MDYMHAQTRPRLILALEGVVGSGVRTFANSKGTVRSIGRLQGGSDLQDSGDSAPPTELFWPQWPLKLVARGFLRVLRFPPLLHRFNGPANGIKLK